MDGIPSRTARIKFAPQIGEESVDGLELIHTRTGRSMNDQSLEILALVKGDGRTKLKFFDFTASTKVPTDETGRNPGCLRVVPLPLRGYHSATTVQYSSCSC
jgi:hypothetical protein